MQKKTKRQTKIKTSAKAINSTQLKYSLYENSVQSPEADIEFFNLICRELIRRKAHVLREDFCGTFTIASAWVKSHPKNKAIALDIDAEPIKIGMDRIAEELSNEQQKRISIHRQNVLNPSKQKADIIIACNFSFYVLQKREELLMYFTSAYKSLKSKSVFALEMVGGPGFTKAPHEEMRRIKHPSGPQNGKYWYTYIWDQKSYNPIDGSAQYAIHFKLASGKKIKNAFTYNWRIWSIPEVIDCLKEAGFTKTVVYWSKYDRKGDPTDEYTQTKTAENDDTWISYVVGIK